MSDHSEYIPNFSSEDERITTRAGEKKTRKKNLKRQPANKKAKKGSTITTTNHDKFFEELNKSHESIVDDVLSDESSIQSDLSTDNRLNPHEPTVGDSQLHSMFKQKLENISQQFDQFINGMVELKKEILDVKRQVAKVEVLIKCRKESTSSDPDIDFLNTLQSYGLPFTTKEQLDALEKKLKEENEKSKLVSALIRINGDSGQLKGSKILKSLTSQIIDAKLLSEFTWTGKSAPNARKHAIKTYTLLLKVIYETTLAADSAYTMRQFEIDMVTKVMKVAFKAEEKR